MKKTVLLVEDDRMLREMLALDLEEAGVSVTAAADGEEAITLMGMSHPDLVLLDLLMPKKDGFAVLQFVRENALTFPIVVISNLSSPEEAQKCLQLGAKDFLVKSDLDTGDLWARIARYF